MNEHMAVRLNHDTYRALLNMLDANGDKRPVGQAADAAVRAWLGDMARNSPAAAVEAARGYQWKSLFLPDGTLLRAQYRGTFYYAQVRGDEIDYHGRKYSPRQFVMHVMGSVRNAWRELWIRSPGDVRWHLADTRRRILRRDFVPHTSAVPAALPFPDERKDLRADRKTDAPADDGCRMWPFGWPDTPPGDVEAFFKMLAPFDDEYVEADGTALVIEEPATAAVSDVAVSDVAVSDIAISDVPVSGIPVSGIPVSGIPVSDIAVPDIHAADFPASDIPASDIPASDIPASDIPASDIAGSDIGGSDIDGSDIDGSDIVGSDIAGSDLAGSDIAGSDIAGSDIAVSNIAVSEPFAPAMGKRPALTAAQAAKARVDARCAALKAKRQRSFLRRGDIVRDDQPDLSMTTRSGRGYGPHTAGRAGPRDRRIPSFESHAWNLPPLAVATVFAASAGPR